QLRGRGNGTDDGPHERRLALAVDPGVIVIGDPQRTEPGRLGLARHVHEGPGVMLLAGEGVRDLGHEHLQGTVTLGGYPARLPLPLDLGELTQGGATRRCSAGPPASWFPLTGRAVSRPRRHLPLTGAGCQPRRVSGTSPSKRSPYGSGVPALARPRLTMYATATHEMYRQASL